MGLLFALVAIYQLAAARYWNAAYLAALCGFFVVPPLLRRFRRSDLVSPTPRMLRGFAWKAAGVALVALIFMVVNLTRGDTTRGVHALVGFAVFVWIALRMSADARRADRTVPHEKPGGED